MNSPVTGNQRRRCRVTSETTPQSLGRIFSLLTLLNLVPSHTESFADEQDCLHLEISFDSVRERDFDLLIRRIAQLTDTLYVGETKLELSEPMQGAM